MALEKRGSCGNKSGEITTCEILKNWETASFLESSKVYYLMSENG